MTQRRSRRLEQADGGLDTTPGAPPENSSHYSGPLPSPRPRTASSACNRTSGTHSMLRTAVAACAFGRENRSRVQGDPEIKRAVREMWALGDYHRVAKQMLWEVGQEVVGACGVSPGQRVLDIAAGTGNIAIRAAQAGADVVACDLAPENFDAGRREALAAGVDLEWVEGDAEALPFGDEKFDVVTSSFGAMFATNHQIVADEMVRVCRPGGTIAMANFTPDGTAGEFFEIVGRYAPPPPVGSQSPLLWGTEAHVRALFAESVSSLETVRKSYVERAPSPLDYRDFYKATFGPVIAIFAGLADQPGQQEAFDRDFLDFAARADRGGEQGAEYHYDYLLVIARKAGGQ